MEMRLRDAGRALLPIATGLAAIVALLFAGPGGLAQEPASSRWEAAIRAFERADRESPLPAGGIVFLGSSSFRRWDLERSFPGKGLINRGFGGSQMADALRYLDRIVLPLKPRKLFLYEGDNDIGQGKSPETVAAEFRELAARVHRELPRTKIVFVSIKPSIRRWHLIEHAREANAQVREICESDGRLEYLDAATPLLGPDGKPREDLFVSDELHLNEAGYDIWAGLLAPHLD